MTLNKITVAALAALSFASLPLVAAEPSAAAGCLSGAVVGGVAGHYAGHHGLMGAVGGCIVGHHMNTVQKEKEAQSARTSATPAPTTN
jgi:hypothetical protein